MHRIRLGLVVAAFASLMATVPAGAQNIVQNPGFENTNGLAPWVTNGGWFVTTSDPHTGAQAASTGCVGTGCVNPPNPATLFQDLVTSPGSTYNLAYWFHDAGDPFELKVFWNGSLVQDLTGPSNTSYALFGVSGLAATGATTRLEFWGRQDPGFNRLDDVSVVAASVNPAPEPASLMLLATGLVGVAGFATRRKRVD